MEPVDSDRKLGTIILDAFDKNPDHVAQIDAKTGEQTSNGKMKECSIRCALWLKKLGIGPQDIIVTCTHNHLDSYVPFIATIFIDAIFNGWNYNITLDGARCYMKQFLPKVIFTCEKVAELLREASRLEKLIVEIVVIGKHSSLPTLIDIINSQAEEEIANFIPVNLKNPEEVAFIFFSSGSTDRQKGIMKSNKSLLSTLLTLPSFTSTVTQKFLWYTTLDWASCIIFILQTILMEQTRIIPTHCVVENLFQTIEKYKINRVFLPPNFIPYVAKSNLTQKYDLKSLHFVIIGGIKYSRDILEDLKQNIPSAFFYYFYGSTELGIVFNATPACKRIESVGIITNNVKAKFVDLTTGANLGPNQPGEICVKSPAKMIGYYNNLETTKQAFDEYGWYHTGDIGYYDETGEVFIVDRINAMIEYRNHQISPVEIEETLLSHPDIQEAIVVALPHEIDGNWPAAFCKKAPNSNVTKEDLMKLTSILEDYKKLRGGIHFIDNFLYTTCGKIARNEMKLLAIKLVSKESE
ncbi:uncharacterized protein LOC131666698 [Phymastichus coffea]|uniref:uncharacterized protein LOC131666698 n=1 Tax=Phymastichus coffea TaxID=108790 RepID=UPI00273CCD10|nr:uncharacterized protein LOC131666698 [Phymastichus coffea]